MNQDDELKADRDEWKARALKAEQVGEPDCATTGVCVRSGLHASPPGAVPVVRKMVEALSLPCDRWNRRQFEITRAALAAGQKFIKENCNG